MSIKKYKDFLLLEYEGGPASKDQVKLGKVAFSEIDPLEDGEEEEDKDKDIDILHDMSESVDDPYNEEIDIDLPEKSYKSWRGSLYDFLMQYGDIEIVKSLKRIEECGSIKDAKDYIEDILSILEEEIDWDDYRKIYDEIDILLELVEDEDGNDVEIGPDPDEKYDRERLERGDRLWD